MFAFVNQMSPENSFIIEDPSETYRGPIWDRLTWSETSLPDWRPQHASLETTCLIGDPSETSTCYIGDQHAWSRTHRRSWHTSSETNMPNQRPRHAKSETDMPERRPIKDQHAPAVTDIPHQRLTCLIEDRHVCIVQLEFKHIYSTYV